MNESLGATGFSDEAVVAGVWLVNEDEAGLQLLMRKVGDL
jgi:hypothetical protein